MDWPKDDVFFEYRVFSNVPADQLTLVGKNSGAIATIADFGKTRRIKNFSPDTLTNLKKENQ